MASPNKTITFGTDLLPLTDSNYDLGTTDLKWNLYVDKINDAVPALTDTNTLQNITLATTTKAYLTGVSTAPNTTASAMEAVADTGVYLTATAGELSSLRYSLNNGAATPAEKAYIKYNTDDDCIDFIFV